MRTTPSSPYVPANSSAGIPLLERALLDSELEILALLQKWGDPSSCNLLQSDLIRPPRTMQQLYQLRTISRKVVEQYAMKLQATPFCEAGTKLLALNQTVDDIWHALCQKGSAPSDWKARVTEALRQCQTAYDAIASPPSKWTRVVRWIQKVCHNIWYVRTADILVASQAHTLQNTLWRGSPPLSLNQLRFSTAVTASALCAIDLAQWGLARPSTSIICALAQSVIPRMGNAAYQYPIELGMICLLDSYLKARSPTETIAVCLVASATAKCAQVIVTRLYRTPHHPTYPLAHTLAQLVAVPSAIRYIVPYVLWQWNALGLHPNKLLDNPALCHAYPNKCRQAAYAVLQLNETAGPRDIREAYRRWVKQWHPDLPSGDGVAFRRGQAAKDLLSAT